MSTASHKNQYSVPVSYFMFGWIIFAAIYVALKYHPATLVYSKYLLMVSLIGADVAAAIIGLWIWSKTPKNAKLVLLFFALSFACLIIDDSVYQIAFNILGIKHNLIGTGLMSAYNIPYLGFLLFQTLAWLTLLPKPFPFKTTGDFAIYLPIIIIVIFTALLLLYIFQSQPWVGQTVAAKFYSYSDATLQIIGFIAALLCLATTKNKGVFCLALAFLIAMLVDLIMTLGFFTEHFGIGSILESSWVLVLALGMCGLINLHKITKIAPKATHWVCEVGSVRAQFVFWATAILIVVLGTFLLFFCLLTNHLFFSKLSKLYFHL